MTRKLLIGLAVLGLTLVALGVATRGVAAPADDDGIDREVRKTLLEIDSHVSDGLARNLASIALAEIASRPGSSQPGDSGRRDIEERLTKSLVRGSTSDAP